MEQLTDHIYRIQLPLPFPLKYIYTYAIKGEKGWTIIDAGLHTKETEELWEDFLRAQNSTWNDIEKIILTHYHPDHYGAGGWLQEKSGAPVYMSQEDYNEANTFWHHESIDMGVMMQEFYLEHGMPTNLANKMILHMHEFLPWVNPQPTVTIISDGDRIQIADDEYLVLATPGHSEGHLCFYQPEKRVLFSGDHILPKITPNVSLWPNGRDKNPLQSFIDSLKKIKNYDMDVAYPAHKTICINPKKRIDEILEHHDERLEHVMGWVGKEATGYEVCEKMFGYELSVHQLRFAMAETLAHLVYLESIGRLRSDKQVRPIMWYPVE